MKSLMVNIVLDSSLLFIGKIKIKSEAKLFFNGRSDISDYSKYSYFLCIVLLCDYTNSDLQLTRLRESYKDY
jgi:hypothetical protein